jgi:pyruvate/2-oxoglutarate dehydrogenase complex dihydrolipoamide acyltransferase (E2) component
LLPLQAPDGTKNIPVGKLIALLAEEGDDISNLEVPKDEKPSQTKPTEASSSASQPQQSSAPPSSIPDKSTTSSSTPPSRPQHGEQPTHSRPLFPSVLRLLQENGISDAEKIKGTGVRGMITKGDVLTHLGKASGPLGTFKAALEKEEAKMKSEKTGAKKAEAPAPPLDGPGLRRLIVSSMLEASQKAYKPGACHYIFTHSHVHPLLSVAVAGPVSNFDDIIADYFPPAPKVSSPPAPAIPPKNATKKGADFLEGLF